MKRIEWSIDALSDLQSISEYIEQDRSVETANRVTRLIYDVIRSLSRHPERGRVGRFKDTREVVVSRTPYVVLYRISSERVIVLNIVHGAQSRS